MLQKIEGAYLAVHCDYGTECGWVHFEPIWFSLGGTRAVLTDEPFLMPKEDAERFKESLEEAKSSAQVTFYRIVPIPTTT